MTTSRIDITDCLPNSVETEGWAEAAAMTTFLIKRDPSGGYVAAAEVDDGSIHTQADDWAALIEAMRDAVRCHFGEDLAFLVMVPREE